MLAILLSWFFGRTFVFTRNRISVERSRSRHSSRQKSNRSREEQEKCTEVGVLAEMKTTWFDRWMTQYAWPNFPCKNQCRIADIARVPPPPNPCYTSSSEKYIFGDISLTKNQEAVEGLRNTGTAPGIAGGHLPSTAVRGASEKVQVLSPRRTSIPRTALDSQEGEKKTRFTLSFPAS